MISSMGRAGSGRGELDAGRIRGYVGWHVVVVVGAIGWVAVLAVVLPRPAAWWAIAAVLIALSPMLIAAWRYARRGHVVAAVLAVTVFNWSAVVAMAAMVPFVLRVQPIAALLPTLLGTPYLRRVQLAALLAATVGAVALMALVGGLSPGVGVEDVAPRWAFDATTVVFLPVVAGLAVFLARQSHQIVATRADEFASSRRRLGTAAIRQRERIERALRFGPGQRIATVTRRVEDAERLAALDRARAATILAEVAADLQETSGSLREMAHGIFPAELTEHGLATLSTLSFTGSTPVQVTMIGVRRYPADVEAAVHFCCAQAVGNVRQHAGPTASAVVTVEDWDRALSLAVTDDGVGCAQAVLLTGEGIAAMTDRIQAVGGDLEVTGRPGGGVQVRGHIPVSEIESRSTDVGSLRGRGVRALAAAWVLLSGLIGGAESPRGPDRPLALGLRALLVSTAGSTAIVAALYPLLRNWWLLVMSAVGVLTVVLLLSAGRADRSGRRVAALLMVTVGLWCSATLATVLAPFALPYTAVVIVVPIVLVVPYLRDSFGRVMIGTIAGTAVVAAAGQFTTGVGLDTGLPRWLVVAQNVFFLLVAATVVLFVVSLNHAAMSERAEQLRLSRARLVAATDVERRRIERDLHDGAQQRLVSAAIQARVAQRQLLTTTHPPGAVLLALIDELYAAATDLQQLCRGVYPAELAEHGVETALRGVAARSPLHTVLTGRGVGRYPSAVEVTIYFCCVEGLQNCIKHAGPTATVTITLTEEAHAVVFEIADDGPGVDPRVLRSGRGFTGMTDRVAAVGGTVQARSAPGGGVVIRGHLPLGGR